MFNFSPMQVVLIRERFCALVTVDRDLASADMRGDTDMRGAAAASHGLVEGVSLTDLPRPWQPRAWLRRPPARYSRP